MKRITYFAVKGEGPYREYLITREGPPGSMRMVSDEPTGVIYKTWKAVIAGLDAKNRTAQIVDA